MNNTLLITGGAGFIGSNFVRLVIAKNMQVINLDKLTYAGNLESLVEFKDNQNHRFIQGSINDKDLVRRILFDYRPRAIINFAAESHVDRSIDGPEVFYETNVMGTVALLEGARTFFSTLSAEEKNEFRFLHISTDEVFGSLGESGYFSETTVYAPNSPYAASKAAADYAVRAYYQTYGLPTLTTNCSNNYGPYQFPEKLIPLVIGKALERKPIPLYGDGKNIRDWLYVMDHCEAIMHVLEKGKKGESYNIGGYNEKSNLMVVETICDIMNQINPLPKEGKYQNFIHFVKDRPGHDRRYAVDATKVKRLGWEPKETFESGIYKTVKWYLHNQEWCKRIGEGTYRQERLGLKGVVQ